MRFDSASDPDFDFDQTSQRLYYPTSLREFADGLWIREVFVFTGSIGSRMTSVVVCYSPVIGGVACC